MVLTAHLSPKREYDLHGNQEFGNQEQTEKARAHHLFGCRRERNLSESRIANKDILNTMAAVSTAETSSARVRFIYELTSALSLAWDSIRSHKLRSFLTLLGVIIGVASVILVGSAIDGLGLYAQESTAKAFGSESFL